MQPIYMLNKKDSNKFIKMPGLFKPFANEVIYFCENRLLTLLTSMSAAGSLCDVGVPHLIGTDPGEVPSDDGDKEGS